VIDDMRPLLTILQSGLTKLGYTVSAALSGKEGLEIFHATPVDAVISDLAMEGLSGFEVAQALRDICAARSIPRPVFVLLTGWGFEVENDARLPEYGVDAVFTKPVEIPELVQTLERLTRERKQCEEPVE
jgi:CheY-like chemotaxis protein